MFFASLERKCENNAIVWVKTSEVPHAPRHAWAKPPSNCYNGIHILRGARERWTTKQKTVIWQKDNDIFLSNCLLCKNVLWRLLYYEKSFQTRVKFIFHEISFVYYMYFRYTIVIKYQTASLPCRVHNFKTIEHPKYTLLVNKESQDVSKR